MSDNSNAKSAIAEPQSESDDSLLTSVNKDSVANYLLENPSFLLENPELLLMGKDPVKTLLEL